MDALSRRLAALAIAVGLCLRLLAAWPVADAARPYAVPQEEYFLSSVMLLSAGVYTVDPGGAPQAWRGPLFTTFLAMTQLGAQRPSPRRARVALAFLGALAGLAAWGLGSRLRSPIAGALAAALVSLDPALIRSVRELDVHGFYGAVILLLAYAAANWAERKGDRVSGNILGLALGASFLCRSAHLAVAPLLAAAALLWWGRAGARRTARVLLVATAVLIPWTLRNFVHTKRFVPLDSGVGAYNLLAAADGGTTAIRIDEAFDIAERHAPGFSALHREESEALREAALAQLSWRLILSSPWEYLSGCVRRLTIFWLPLWLFLIPASFAALSSRASRGTRAAALVAAAFSAYAAIGLGDGYRLGVEPLLAALAGIGAAGYFKRGTPLTGAAPLRAAMPLIVIVGGAAALCLLITPLDALAARRSWQPDCRPPAGPLIAFLDDGVRLVGERWYLASWPGALRARPDVCAGMAAYNAGDMKQAALRFDSAAALAPRDPAIRISLAVALRLSGDKNRALRECATAETLATALTPSNERRRLLESIRSTRAEMKQP